ncbi:NAD(P)H-dependent oxidoreductase [Cohnella suwonensis]|uniref:NAD(P)H-dependent oxidoreductase n=1 Tax=Cohnella suwonensis TaxID=696072 RepID=A0ABW0M3Y7_9BACL
MKSNVLVINGHPDDRSFCAALSDAYREGAAGNRATVKTIDLGRIDFVPILKFGYRQRIELEPPLLEAQELIRWADHLVFVYPTWWGTMPALLKGFVDRVFLPGFAFKYRENSVLWDKLLKGKTARLIVTSDTPSWYNRIFYKRAGHLVMQRNILKFCGITPVKITEIGPVKSSTLERRDQWLTEVRRLGERLA